jgi:Adenylate cyclase, family 3 (some proteins contain HAMP domain)
MTHEADPVRPVQIAHVLFLDLVGYSQEKIRTQGYLLDRLNAAVRGTDTFSRAVAQGEVLAVPTGDGMALLFFHDVTGPARCAVELARATRNQMPPLPFRVGMHSGLVQRQIDISGKENVVGEGINTAQRVMDLGDVDHLLLSAQYAALLGEFDEWSPCVTLLGEAEVKHGLRLTISSLAGDGFGRCDPPARFVAARTDGPERTAETGAPPSRGKVAVLYKRDAQPDENILTLLEATLHEGGYEVLLDRHRKLSIDWARESEERIRSADAVIAIVSPESMQSEMLEWELEAANDQQHRTGKPLILPVNIGAEGTARSAIMAVIAPLNQFYWSGPRDDQRLVAELMSAIREPIKVRQREIKLEPVGGAVPPDSPFYVERSCDQELAAALDARESILLIKGARQIGKTSLQARGARIARQKGWRVALTDFQKLTAAQMQDEDAFCRLLAATLSRQLKFSYDFATEWLDLFGANLNMEQFLRELLDQSDEPLVWCIDEADKLFSAPFAADFFGLVRSWHNSRSTEPGGPWSKLSILIAYATEAHLFIQDLNQSPFNVGRRLDLEDFNLQQLVDLNGRYGSPLNSYAEAEQLHDLIGGQPFLSRQALDTLATGKCSFATLMEQAHRDDGPFHDHLKRLLIAVVRLPEVTDYARTLLADAGSAAPVGVDHPAHYRLLSAGVIRQDRGGRVRFRCKLYQRYLATHIPR